MSSIINKINWIVNGERANADNLNAPLLSYLEGIESGSIISTSNSTGIKISAANIDGAVEHGDVISFDDINKKFVQATPDNKANIIGIIDLNSSIIYVQGAIDFLSNISPVTKYFLDSVNPGKLSTADNGIYIGLGFKTDIFVIQTGIFASINGGVAGGGSSLDVQSLDLNISTNVSNGDLVALDSNGSVIKATVDMDNILGIIDINKKLIYSNGIINYSDLKGVTLSSNQKYYASTTAGEITTSRTRFYIGTALDNNNLVIRLGAYEGLVRSTVVYNKALFTANAGDTTFAVNYSVGYIDVFKNGVKLRDVDDYSATNGTSITLTLPANAGDTIEIIGWVNTLVYDGEQIISVIDGGSY